MPRLIEIEDLARITYVGDPQIAPDGSRIAYVATEIDLPKKAYRSSIWVAAPDGSWNRRFTRSDGKDMSPRWSPDSSRLAFLSDRGGATQLHVIDRDGGEARKLTDLKNGVADPAWAPDGSRIAVTSKVGPEGMVILAEQSEEEKAREREQSDVKVITSVKYKLDGEGFLGDLKRHIFVVPLDGDRPTQITDGDWSDAQPAWSPDGTTIAFVSNRTENREMNTVNDVWVVPVNGGEPRRLTGSDGSYGLPTFSPDGATVAFTGHPFSERYGPNTIDDLWLIPASGGEARNLAADLDREIGGTTTSDAHYTAPPQRPVWCADGASLLVQVGDRGNVGVLRISLDGETRPVLDDEREILNFSVATDGTIAFVATDPTRPLEVYAANADGSGERRISHANDDFLAEVTLSAPEHFTYPNEEGQQIDGWLLKPPTAEPGQRHPTILEIHGGPHGMYGNSFNHEFQVLAARGYAVLYTNPRGSTGSGQAFTAGAMGDWGGADYRDLMAGVDQAVARDDIDAERLGVTGGSYAGYMTNWIVTHTDRFKAAVTMRSTCNRHNLVGTSDLVWSFAGWEFGGSAYERPEFYLERSPLTYVANVRTPILILHSENDYRCPIEQAEQFFVALKLHGKVTEFVRFPNESHGLARSGRPDHRVERLRRVVDWFNRHLS